MLAALLYGVNDLRIEETKTPECGPNDILLRVKAAGLCVSDVRTISFGDERVVYPQILGHEVSGEVVAVGSAVAKYKEGQRIYVSPIVPCNACPACSAGWHYQCENLNMLGTTMPGGFAEYMLVNRDIIESGQIISMPDHMTYEEALMTEPLSSVYASQEYADVTLGDTVVVFGTGVMGCLHVELAKLRGALRVIAVDKLKASLSMADRFGADYLINAAAVDPVDRVMRLTGNCGADKVIVANGAMENLHQAIALASKRGKVIFFNNANYTKIANFDMGNIQNSQLALLWCSGYNHSQSSKAFSLIDSRRFGAGTHITQVLPLRDIKKGIDMFRDSKAYKIVFHP